MSTLETTVNVVGFVLLVMFLAYVTLILVPFLGRRRARRGLAHLFEWHMFVPCLDEELVIDETLTRFTRDFPSVHVWVIDDASDDATPQIVSRWASAHPRVHLVERRRPDARQGKGAALNAAYHALHAWRATAGDELSGVSDDRVVVGVIDADGELVPGALEHMSGKDVFLDPEVGAAQASVAMNNTGRKMHAGTGVRAWLRNARARWLLRSQDIEFRTTIAAMQTLRLRTASAGMGGNGQFTRLVALDAIGETYGEPWHGALLEDYELGIHTMLAGYRTRYVHDAVVRQEALPAMCPYLRQRTRWTQGGMQCAAYAPKIVASPGFTNAGVVESLYFLSIPWLGLLGVVIWPVIAAFVVTGAVATHTTATLLAAAWWLVPLTMLTGIGPFVLWAFVYRSRDDPDSSIGRAVVRGFGYWLYSYTTYPVLVRAAGRVLRGHSGWEKTARVGAGVQAAVLDQARAVKPAGATARSPALPGAGGADADVIELDAWRAA
ncbi:glycosyltransferase [Paraoerskovia marina]|uniref:glycosyltransferase n=1 Tax=Paraoerskovia marina TaxID=545619 RepID=UPI0009DCAA1C|nr:glycosyltransferase [Paraoerskovia marina]